MGLIDRWAKLASAAPALVNLIASTPPAKWLAGIDRRARLPRFASRTFRSWFRDRTSGMGGDRILLWPDTFNDHFRPETLIAATQLLARGGFQVAIPPEPLCCGRPLYDWGFLDAARQRFERIFKVLREDIDSATPIVVLEPACASVFKDELLNLLPDSAQAKRLSAQVEYIPDFVARQLDRFPKFLRGGAALVQAHCHHHALFGFDSEKQLLDELGIIVERPPQGCCGMAGAFGMARESFEVGKAIGERLLLPRVRELSPEAVVVADGFSCREQIESHTARRATHIVELLRERMA
jgi:Fe-S oxidoreductase